MLRRMMNSGCLQCSHVLDRFKFILKDLIWQVVFDGANPGGFKALFFSFYAPELNLGAVLPHQVPNSVPNGAD